MCVRARTWQKLPFRFVIILPFSSALAREVATRAVHGSTHSSTRSAREYASLSLYLYRRVSLSLTLRLRSSVEMSRRARPRRGRPLRRLDDSLTSADCRATAGETGESWGGGPSAGQRQEVRHDKRHHAHTTQAGGARGGTAIQSVARPPAQCVPSVWECAAVTSRGERAGAWPLPW